MDSHLLVRYEGGIAHFISNKYHTAPQRSDKQYGDAVAGESDEGDQCKVGHRTWHQYGRHRSNTDDIRFTGLHCESLHRRAYGSEGSRDCWSV